MKELSISNVYLTLVLKKSVSAMSNITVYDLHFALFPMKTEILRFFPKYRKFEYICCDFMIRMYVLKVLNGHIQNLA